MFSLRSSKSNLYSHNPSLLWKKPLSLSSALYHSSISESHYKILLNYIFLFMVFCWGQEMLNSSIENPHCFLALSGIMYSIDSSNSLRFTKFFQNIVHWALFFYQSDVNQKYYAWRRIFRLLRWSQLCLHLMELPIRTLWNYPSL